jgi:Fic family protein
VAGRTDSSTVERLIEAVGQHAPDGAGIEQLEASTKLPRRTLQRRLAELVRDGRLRATGVRRGRRYHVPDQSGGTPTQITVSEQGELVRVSIRRPLIQRTPVGYDPRFLESYRPNASAYLDLKMRRRLHSLGRTAGPERPAGTYARQILSRLLVDLSWASSRLEGNTYTRLDTQNLIEFGRQAPGKDRRETQMILNHKAAIEMLVDNVDEIDFNRYTVCNLHALLADNLLPTAAAGRVRRIEVNISGTVYQPLAIPQRLDELFDLLLATAAAIRDPFEQAFFIMIQLPYLQPFEDVNKRVSRLAANIPFIKQNLIPLSFVDVPDRDYVDSLLAVYETNRIELARDVFLWAYERSCQRYTVVRDALPQPDPVRLRNREQLIEIVNAIVRDDLAIEESVVRKLATPIVGPDDLEQMIAMAITELHDLHEGALARYRLRPSEFRRWRGRST